jgi:predicted permease
MQSAKSDVLPALKEGATTAGPRRSKLRAVFMTTQVAMSTLLLVVAGLLVRGLANAHTVDRGLVTDGVLAASVDLESAGYTSERGVAFYERLHDRLEQTPGVAAANIVDIVPLNLSNRVNEMVKENPGAQDMGSAASLVYQNIVSPGHFLTLGIPLVAGRDFDARDRTGGTPVVIINEMLARRYWPGESPVGKRVRQREGRESFGPWLEIVGVARDSRYVTVGEDPKLFMYRPLAQAYRSAGTILVKSRGSAKDALPALRTAVEAHDPNLALFSIMTLDAATSISLLPVKVAATLTAVLGVLALILGVIGLYGVMSYLVRQRTREIGIRMALGARSGTVVRLIAGQGIHWTAIGLALGLGAAFGMARLIAGFLYGISPTDPIAFAMTTLLLTATAFIACYVPARRASRIDPLVALRNE